MSINVDERLQQLEDLDVYIDNVETELTTLVNRLGWRLDYSSCDREMVQCPLNVGHRVPKDRLEKHLQLCTLKSEGYLEDDSFLPDACDFGASRNVVTIDGNLANSIISEAVKINPNIRTDFWNCVTMVVKISFLISFITNYTFVMLCQTHRLPKENYTVNYPSNLDVTRPIPRTSDRIMTDFTTDERRALYDYVIAQSETESIKIDDLHLPFRNETKQEEPKSFLEIMAAERDARRRRVSYRTKKVSTNRKSHLEVMREVIQNQMELYTEWLNKDVEQEDKSNLSADNSGEKNDNLSDSQGNHWNSRNNPRQISSNQQFEDHLSDYSSRKHAHYNQSKGDSSSHSGYDSRFSHPHNRSRDDNSRDSRAGHSRRHDGHESRRRYSSRERKEERGSERRYREKDSRDRKNRRHISPTEQNGKRKRESGHPEIDLRREQYHSTEGYGPNKIIKNEKDDPRNIVQGEARIALNKQVDTADRPDFLDGIMENVTKLADRSNEWSYESGSKVSKDRIIIKGSPKTSEKRKKSKKDKKSKHKRKKHAKKSKHSDSEVSDFSC